MAKGKKTGGRTAGTPNVATAAIKAELAQLFTPGYFKSLPIRLADGKLAPAIEAKLLAYRFGEPKQTVTHDGELTHVARIVHEHRNEAV